MFQVFLHGLHVPLNCTQTKQADETGNEQTRRSGNQKGEAEAAGRAVGDDTDNRWGGSVTQQMCQQESDADSGSPHFGSDNVLENSVEWAEAEAEANDSQGQHKDKRQ